MMRRQKKKGPEIGLSGEADGEAPIRQWGCGHAQTECGQTLSKSGTSLVGRGFVPTVPTLPALSSDHFLRCFRGAQVTTQHPGNPVILRLGRSLSQQSRTPHQSCATLERVCPGYYTPYCEKSTAYRSVTMWSLKVSIDAYHS
jgi:hypothetical protein